MIGYHCILLNIFVYHSTLLNDIEYQATRAILSAGTDTELAAARGLSPLHRIHFYGLRPGA